MTAPNFGNWFDSIFKKPWLALTSDVAATLTPEAVSLQAIAESKIAAAKQAAAEALDAHTAAVEAMVTTPVDNAIAAGASHLPGPVAALLTGAAEATANDFTDSFIHGWISKLEGFLSPNPSGAGSTLDAPPM